MKLDEKILYYRRRARLSQEELASRVGVSRQAVSKWETGAAVPEIDRLVLLARTFGVTVDELVSDEAPEEPPSGKDSGEDGTEGDFRLEEEKPPSPEQEEPDSAERVVRFLRPLVRRFGWLAGVYVALSGLGMTVFGALVLGMTGAFRNTASLMGGGSVLFEGDIPPGLYNDQGQLIAGGTGGISGFSTPFTGAASGMTNFISGVGSLFLLAGILVMIAGAVLAVWLYRRRKGDT